MTPAFDPVGIVLIALLCDAVLAGIPGIRQVLALPALAVDGAARWFDTRLNRPQRGATSRKMRGALVVVLVAVPAAILGYYLAQISRTVSDGWIIEAAFATTMLIQRRYFGVARRVRRALRRNGLNDARTALGREVPYDTAGLDEHAVARGAIEVCATGFCSGVIAPVFWYFILGLPGMFVYRAVNVTAARIGSPAPRLAAFGLIAERLDKALTYLLAPLSGIILATAALFVPGAGPVRAFRVMFREARQHVSPVAGWTESAVAGALDLALSGPHRYEDATVSGPWIGGGRARASAHDLGRALFLFVVACVITAGVIAAIALAAMKG